jgi:crotonobetainyl-CoA:carnitine CoA-transferase CaiB-like acyl-CoA transferase
VAWLPADGAVHGAPALGAHTDEVLRSLGVDPGHVV